MKKSILFLLMIGSTLSCSVDSVETDQLNTQELELSTSIESSGCEGETIEFEGVGAVEVSNDDDYLYVTVTANAGYTLKSAKLHLVEDPTQFPTVGQGNLPPGKMKHSAALQGGETEYTFILGREDNECLYLASHTAFVSEQGEVEKWAGNTPGTSGDWFYMKYCYQECIPSDSCSVSAGKDNEVTISLEEAVAFESQDAVEDYFLNNIIESWVNDYGTFTPSIETLIEDFNADFRAGNFTEEAYTTVYTVTDGTCSDSATVTLRVVNSSAE